MIYVIFVRLADADLNLSVLPNRVTWIDPSAYVAILFRLSAVQNCVVGHQRLNPRTLTAPSRPVRSELNKAKILTGRSDPLLPSIDISVMVTRTLNHE